ncbi:hypothetical protein D3C71_1489990 [compost metagenome]
MGDLTTAFGHKKLGCQLSSPVIVRAETGDLLVDFPVNRNNWRTKILVFFNLKRMAAHNDSIHPVPLQHFDIIPFFGGIHLGIAEQNLVSFHIRVVLHPIRQLAEKGMRDVGNDQSQNIRLLAKQGTRNFIGLVVQFIHCLIHLAAGRLADVSPIIHNTGDGCYRYPCF